MKSKMTCKECGKKIDLNAPGKLEGIYKTVGRKIIITGYICQVCTEKKYDPNQEVKVKFKFSKLDYGKELYEP